MTEVNFENAGLLETALYLRAHAAPHLRLLSMGSLESRLMSFVTDHYHLLANETFLESFDCSYADRVSAGCGASFAAALATSDFFVEPRLTALFPLVPVRVEQSFEDESFFLSAPRDLGRQLEGEEGPGELAPNSFPPREDWSGRREAPNAWLGVRAATTDAAAQTRAAVLGAVALLPHRFERYTFSGRHMFGGRFVLEKGRWSMSFGDPHTPALMTDITIGPADREWLAELARKLASPVKADRRQLRALEYYYRAWAPDPVKRFPTLFAAIDAIFGDAAKATQAVVDAVAPVMGPDYTSERVRLILGLRASVIHGGAPNVYESSKYEAYYRAYRTDPVGDFELVVARCLQQVVFPGTMAERPHTHADLILRHSGRRV